MPTPYAIRVDIIGDDTHARMERFLSVYDKYLVYEEIAAKTKKLHLQGIVWTDGTDSAIRTRWLECYPSDPWEAKYEKKKSCTKMRKDSYEIYITKDENLKYSKNYTEEEIKHLQEQSYKKEEKEEKKKPTFQEIVLQRFQDSVAKLGTEYWVIKGRKITNHKEITRDVLIVWLVREFRTLGKLWDTPVITKYANFLHHHIDPEGHEEAFVMACRDRW